MQVRHEGSHKKHLPFWSRFDGGLHRSHTGLLSGPNKHEMHPFGQGTQNVESISK